MQTNILSTIFEKGDYMMAIEAVTGSKTSFTQEEMGKLEAMYTADPEGKFGFASKDMAKMLLVLDTAPDKLKPAGSPLASIMTDVDLEALTALSELCADRKRNITRVEAAKDAALKNNANKSLVLANARLALDVLAAQSDIETYREDIQSLAEALSGVDDEEFKDVGVFIMRVTDRVR